MRMGRMRTWLASTKASNTERPCSRNCSTKTIRTIALVTTTPMSSKNPMRADRLSVRPVTVKAIRAPTIARGRLITTTKGLRSEPRVATITRYTRATPIAIAMKTSSNPSAICRKIPPVLTSTDGGRSKASILACSATPTALVSSDSIPPVMLADRSPSNLLIDTGPFSNAISLRAPSFSRPNGPSMFSDFSLLMSATSSGSPRTTTSIVSPSSSTSDTVSPTVYRAT